MEIKQKEIKAPIIYITVHIPNKCRKKKKFETKSGNIANLNIYMKSLKIPKE